MHLAKREWMGRRQLHRERVASWCADRVERASRGIRHPVYDFLFEYYSFRPAYLERWSPEPGTILEGATPEETDWPDDFVPVAGGVVIPRETFPVRRIAYLQWAHRYLSAVLERQPSFCCFGLHEWAMLYRSDESRHSQVPLRLNSTSIAAVLDASELRCTHYDAYRFFTAAAAPRNRSTLSRATTTTYDQRGCIHVTMDLYKFAHKIAPWCPSELIADSFLLAADARQIDMRASPYDLSGLGFEPICIESARGREEYIAEQRRLTERGVPIRKRLLGVYASLLDTFETNSPK